MSLYNPGEAGEPFISRRAGPVPCSPNCRHGYILIRSEYRGQQSALAVLSPYRDLHVR
jgi:hypothetical protein